MLGSDWQMVISRGVSDDLAAAGIIVDTCVHAMTRAFPPRVTCRGAYVAVAMHVSSMHCEATRAMHLHAWPRHAVARRSMHAY